MIYKVSLVIQIVNTFVAYINFQVAIDSEIHAPKQNSEFFCQLVRQYVWDYQLVIRLLKGAYLIGEKIN